jgi:hypothetical protein
MTYADSIRSLARAVQFKTAFVSLPIIARLIKFDRQIFLLSSGVSQIFKLPISSR